jgi:hypothetical protein
MLKVIKENIIGVFEAMLVDVKLFVDGEEIALNEFVNRILGGVIAGAVISLRGVKEDWKKIRIEVTK